jgi:hypothetical protein
LLDRLEVIALAVAVVLATVWLARSAAGRRACALLAIPVTPLILLLKDQALHPFDGSRPASPTWPPPD